MINLQLTDEQAFSLRMLLDRVDGNATKSRRKHTQEILRQLIWEHDVPYDDELSARVLVGEPMFRWESDLS